MEGTIRGMHDNSLVNKIYMSKEERNRMKEGKVRKYNGEMTQKGIKGKEHVREVCLGREAWRLFHSSHPLKGEFPDIMRHQRYR